MIICMNFYDFGHLRSTGFFKNQVPLFSEVSDFVFVDSKLCFNRA